MACLVIIITVAATLIMCQAQVHVGDAQLRRRDGDTISTSQGVFSPLTKVVQCLEEEWQRVG